MKMFHNLIYMSFLKDFFNKLSKKIIENQESQLMMTLQAELEKKTRVIAALTETNDLLLAQNREKDVTIMEERKKSAAEIRERDERIAELEGGDERLLKQHVGTIIELNDEKEVRLQEQNSFKKNVNELELQVTELKTQLNDVERRKEKEIKELNENINETRFEFKL